VLFVIVLTMCVCVCVVMTFDLVWSSFAVKGFWALWDNITVAMLMRLQERRPLICMCCLVETVH
jgi:hypothetical protein